jgi:hypothetical protein
MNTFMPVVIVGASARADIQEFAGQARVQKFFSFLILQLDEAALTAAIAKRLPLLLIQLTQRLVAPELITVFFQLAIPA